MRLRIAGILMLAGLGCSLPYATAFSFDCAKASTPTEQAICAHEPLIRLDDALGARYAEAMGRAPEEAKAKLRADQRTWLRERNRACGSDVPCLRAAMEKRIAELGAPGNAPPAGPAQAMGYEMIRIANKGKTVDVAYPQLKSTPAQSIQATINQDLAAEAKDWKCEADEQDQANGEISFSVKGEVARLDAAVFSIKLAFESSCGAPYPDAHVEGRTYDLKTGKRIELKDLFNPGFKTGSLNKIVLLGRPIKRECKEVYDDDTAYRFYANARGLVVIPDLPHAAEACAEEFELPVAKIQQDLRPGTFLTGSK